MKLEDYKIPQDEKEEMLTKILTLKDRDFSVFDDKDQCWFCFKPKHGILIAEFVHGVLLPPACSAYRSHTSSECAGHFPPVVRNAKILFVWLQKTGCLQSKETERWSYHCLFMSTNCFSRH